MDATDVGWQQVNSSFTGTVQHVGKECTVARETSVRIELLHKLIKLIAWSRHLSFHDVKV